MEAKGCLLCGVALLLALPEDEGLDVFCLNFSSVSFKRRSSASSSWLWEVTACFLGYVNPRHRRWTAVEVIRKNILAI